VIGYAKSVNFKADAHPDKLRGGYYTPTALALPLARWGLAGGARTVLEPSCGDGAILKALAAVATSPLAVDAVELIEVEAARACLAAAALPGATVHRAEYLRWASELPDDRRYDLVIGNPPYIRYQYFDDDLTDRAVALLQAAGVPWSRHVNAWVPFLVDAVGRLAPDGRLAMVVPAELMQVKYTGPVRDFLARELATVTVVAFADLVFPEVQQEVVLVLGEKGGPRRGVRLVEVRGANDLDSLVARVDAAVPAPTATGAKWTAHLLPADVQQLLGELDLDPRVQPLGQLARVEVGIVTGANAFFAVDAATVARHGLEPIALPMLGRSSECAGLSFNLDDHQANSRAGRPVHLLAFPSQPPDALRPAWQAYVAQGEKELLHQRFKCRIREPWYAVPSIWASPVSLFKRCHGHTRLILNTAAAHSTDTVYRVRPLGGDPRALVVSFLNTLSLLSSELEGRSYGGGVLELIPSEISRLRVPYIADASVLFDELDQRTRQGERIEVLLDRVDKVVLRRGLGMSAAQVARLRAGWRLLRDRRLGRRH
jgi:adenine-specific DNA-methyltransferase